jgi:hypothetical protein
MHSRISSEMTTLQSQINSAISKEKPKNNSEVEAITSRVMDAYFQNKPNSILTLYAQSVGGLSYSFDERGRVSFDSDKVRSDLEGLAQDLKGGNSVYSISTVHHACQPISAALKDNTTGQAPVPNGIGGMLAVEISQHLNPLLRKRLFSKDKQANEPLPITVGSGTYQQAPGERSSHHGDPAIIYKYTGPRTDKA